MLAWLKRIFDRSNDPVYSCNLYRDKEAGSCANSWSLWIEYVDPDGNMTREEFDAMTTEQKVSLQAESFGTED